NELFAVTILKTAHKMNLNVPKDLAIIAFTDGIISKYSTPTITTVSQSGIKMGKKAAEILIARLESEEDDNDEEIYKTEIIETHLIERESTD
ncbi:MAG: LacI family transcriptional regulator, partial [Flavobacterium sp.]